MRAGPGGRVRGGGWGGGVGGVPRLCRTQHAQADSSRDLSSSGSDGGSGKMECQLDIGISLDSQREPEIDTKIIERSNARQYSATISDEYRYGGGNCIIPHGVVHVTPSGKRYHVFANCRNIQGREC